MSIQRVPIDRSLGRALILEDDDAFAVSLADVLREEGFVVERATSIVEARQKLADGVAVLLLDMNLGEARGRHLLDDLAEAGVLPPTVIVSGDPDAASIAREFSVGCVRKPCSLEEIVAAVGVAIAFDVRPIVSRKRSGTHARVKIDDDANDVGSKDGT